MSRRYFGSIIDGHEDIASNWVYLKRDFLLSAHQNRLQSPIDKENGNPTVGLPDLIKGNVKIVFATIWVPPCLPGVKERPCYHTPTEAYSLARQQLEYYKDLASAGHITLIKTRTDLRSVIETSDRVGFVLLMEGADPIVSSKELNDWYSDGLRILAPSWRATRYAGGTHMPGPLTEAGRDLMIELNKTHLILDVSHMTDEGFYEALDLFHGTMIASHSNCRVYVPTERQLSDEMIRALISRDGVIGTVFYNSFLVNGWKENESKKSEVTLAHAVKQIQHICKIAGNARHVGIGSDLDGGFGVDGAPAEIDTVADLSKLGDALSQEDFSEGEVQGAMYGNWLRILERTLPA